MSMAVIAGTIVMYWRQTCMAAIRDVTLTPRPRLYLPHLIRRRFFQRWAVAAEAVNSARSNFDAVSCLDGALRSISALLHRTDRNSPSCPVCPWLLLAAVVAASSYLQITLSHSRRHSLSWWNGEIHCCQGNETVLFCCIKLTSRLYIGLPHYTVDHGVTG